MSGDATQDRFLGAILGMAIGDAFGMPVAGLSAQTINDLYGDVRHYLPRTFADGESVNPGEITDETEFALCVIESITAGQGAIDVENIGIRMSYLARADSRRWMTPEVASSLDGPSEASSFQLPLRDDAPVGADILARGIPIGLLHAMGPLDAAALGKDAEAVTRITHGSPMAISLVEAAALAMSLASRKSCPLSNLASEVRNHVTSETICDALTSDPLSESTNASRVPAADVLAQAIAVAGESGTFEDVLHTSAHLGGPADSRTAVAGALFAGHHGSSVIPQRFIDNLEARIYVSLAVPWYYRTVARRSGRVLDLKRTMD